MATRFIAIVIFALLSTAFADTALSDSFLNAGLKAYLNGNIEEAIDLFQKSSAENPANTKAKNALLSALLFEGKKRFSDKNFLSAKGYFDRALALDPANAVAKDYLSRMPADKALTDVGEAKAPQKSRIEKDLETRAGAAEPRTNAAEAAAPQARAEQYQRIIVETSNIGASSEGLNEFLAALKAVEKQSREAGDLKFSLGAEQARSRSKNIIFITALVALAALFVAVLSYFIVRFYRFRVKLAEHSYQFTAAREAKILQVMNNVVNLEYKSAESGGAKLIANEGASRPLLEQAPAPGSDEVILIPDALVKRLEDLGAREQVSRRQMELDLGSANAHVRAIAILSCMLHDKQRALDLVVHAVDMEFENAKLMVDLVKVAAALSDLDLFALLLERRGRLASHAEAVSQLRTLAEELRGAGKISGEAALERQVEEFLGAS